MIRSLLFILFFIVCGIGVGLLIYTNSKGQPKKKGVVDLSFSAKNKAKLNKIGGSILGAGLLCTILIPFFVFIVLSLSERSKFLERFCSALKFTSSQ